MSDQVSESATAATAAMGAGPMGDGPPWAPLAFRVGVVGHRPDRLGRADLDSLARVIRRVLGAVRAEVEAAGARNAGCYADSPAVLRAVSPLAEGADRVFAEQALDLGFELCCVTPFPRAEYEGDFSAGRALEDGSLDCFRRLFARAMTRFELDGSRADEGAAYGACGQVVLNQSDLLVVVWDGELHGKRRGTEEILGEARRRGLPVAWIDARSPHAVEVVGDSCAPPAASAGPRSPSGDGDFDAALRSVVRMALDPPGGSGDGRPAKLRPESPDERGGLTDFYAERRPRYRAAVPWRWFRGVVGRGPIALAEAMPGPAGNPVGKESPAASRAISTDGLGPFYGWADALAVQYSDTYRSAFIVGFLLAAMAVGLALFPLGWAWLDHGYHAVEAACTSLEMVTILTILILVFAGRKRRWHARSIDYRMMAEMVRHLRLMAPLGGGRPFPQVPQHWTTYGQPGATWVAWYIRAVERAFGLPSAVVDKAHVDGCLAHLGASVAEQVRYHTVNAGRCGQIERRLHRWAVTTLALTLLACGLHLLPHLWHASPPPSLSAWLILLCGFLPAVGSSLAGISNQGEFRRVARRSEAMREHMDLLSQQILGLRRQIAASAERDRPQFSRHAAMLADDAARLMVNEVLDWRVVFLDRPLDPPA